jgi:hypothetical protein
MAVTTEPGLGPPPGEPDPNEWPRGERARRRLPILLRTIRDDMSLLGRQQLELSRQEFKEIASEKAAGAGLLTAAAILGLFMLGFLAFAGAEGLAIVLPRWAAFLIVAGIFLILTLIAVFAGREALKRPAAPERTKQMVKEDVEWAKRRLKR